MARVVVVGGGFGGLSAAARLAKLHHEVVLLEASEVLGGRLLGHHVGDHAWPLTLDTVTLPGVLRDLFRKSGRPLERVLDLVPTEGRRHVFVDKSVLDLPFGDRAAQHQAVTGLLDGSDPWSPWLDGMADSWDTFRRSSIESLDRPDAAVGRALRARRRMVKRAYRELRDDRLERVVLDPFVLDGEYLPFVPAFLAVENYVERTFGRWRVDGGLPALAAALAARLEERGVEVRTGAHAHEVRVPKDRVTGVLTDTGELAADLVVWCAPRTPHPVPEPRGLPIIPASRTLIRLSPDAPRLPLDVVAHSKPPMHLWSDGSDRWTIAHHNAEDPLIALVRVGIDLRRHVLERHDLSPVELVSMGAWGWQWQGWRTAGTRPSTAFEDTLFFAGANAHPGATIEMIGSQTAAIAERIGKA
ncbi:MAG TPA: FAD-dependent oxidoreductase [Aeromicrobium sp.]|nr:FAD-dependent oxidoreductase [Aeromicrobium sp.]